MISEALLVTIYTFVVGLDEKPGLYIGDAPDIKDAAEELVMIREYGGNSDPRIAIDRKFVQFLARGRYRQAMSILNVIKNNLQASAPIVEAEFTIFGSYVESLPAYIGKDPTNRALCSMNMRFDCRLNPLNRGNRL